MTYLEKVVLYEDAYEAILNSLDAVLESKSVKDFFGLVLACGNYLNGNTGRGQADGFELEDLKKLDSIKDNDGKQKCFQKTHSS